MQCKWQVEIDPYCQKVLAKHWPNVTRWDDVKTFPPEQGDWNVDVICGGFPCQDISYAGNGRGQRGIDGERSGLWKEMVRIIGHLRPRVAVVENSPALLHRGMGTVLGDLADIGYDAEWDCIPAAAVGALHIRNRVFIVAYPNDQRDRFGSEKAFLADANNQGKSGITKHGEEWYRLPNCTGEAFTLPEPAVERVADGIS